jgi:hypothetical protein
MRRYRKSSDARDFDGDIKVYLDHIDEIRGEESTINLDFLHIDQQPIKAVRVRSTRGIHRHMLLSCLVSCKLPVQEHFFSEPIIVTVTRTCRRSSRTASSGSPSSRCFCTTSRRPSSRSCTSTSRPTRPRCARRRATSTTSRASSRCSGRSTASGGAPPRASTRCSTCSRRSRRCARGAGAASCVTRCLHARAQYLLLAPAAALPATRT